MRSLPSNAVSVPAGFAALWLGYALMWALAAFQVQLAPAAVGSIEERAVQVERAAVLSAPAPRIAAAPAPRGRALQQVDVLALALAAAHGDQELGPCGMQGAPRAPLGCAWLRCARRLPRSDCSEPGSRG